MSKKFEIVGDDISDGYHTFNELYDHRIALFLRLCESGIANVFYKLDYEEWFCVYLQLPEGQISYHVPNTHLERVMKIATRMIPIGEDFWDGHKPQDVINRLNHIKA